MIFKKILSLAVATGLAFSSNAQVDASNLPLPTKINGYEFKDVKQLARPPSKTREKAALAGFFRPIPFLKAS